MKKRLLVDRDYITKIREKLVEKSTIELLEIWKEYNLEKHSWVEFLVIRELLIERGETLPFQSTRNDSETGDDILSRSTQKKRSEPVFKFFLIASHLVLAFVFLSAAASMEMGDPYANFIIIALYILAANMIGIAVGVSARKRFTVFFGCSSLLLSCPLIFLTAASLIFFPEYFGLIIFAAAGLYFFLVISSMIYAVSDRHDTR